MIIKESSDTYKTKLVMNLDRVETNNNDNF